MARKASKKAGSELEEDKETLRINPFVAVPPIVEGTKS